MIRDASWFKIRNIWYGMRKRCYDKTYSNYRWYGGKGVRISDRWMSFDNFYEDMKDTWFPGATIDRIDCDGNYTSENCQWLSIHENRQRCNSGISNQRRSDAIKEFRSDLEKSQKWRDSLKGYKKTPEHLEKIFAKIVCPICGRSISKVAMTRHKKANHNE